MTIVTVSTLDEHIDTSTETGLIRVTSYYKHVCVCVCVRASVCACVRNGRSPEVIRPLAKYYHFLWAMATVGQREGVQ